ncbi:alpha/beta hydrolase [Methylosoma difficile]
MKTSPSVTAQLKTLLQYSLAALLLAVILILAIAWYSAGQLAQPTRRPLQTYHQDWLLQPQAHGMLLSRTECGNGRVPCLMVAPDAHSAPGKRGTLLRQQLTSMGSKVLSYGETRGILVLLHGRNGRKEDLLPVAERFVAAGFKCVIPDLPAHGDSPLKQLHFATQTTESALPVQVLNDARRYFNEPDAPAALWGLSMGGAFAIRSVKDSPQQWRALIIVSSFNSLPDVIADQLQGLPPLLSQAFVGILAPLTQYRGGADLYQVQPEQWASQITQPVLVIHGEDDPLITLKRGSQLFAAFQNPNKMWISVPKANHHNILVTEMPLYAKMGHWLMAYF